MKKGNEPLSEGLKLEVVTGRAHAIRDRFSEPREDWASYYLDYEGLSSRLMSIKREFGLRKALSTYSMSGENRTFAEVLDSEIEKVVLFFLRKQGTLAKCVAAARASQHDQLKGTEKILIGTKRLDYMHEQYVDLAKEVLALLEYLRINVTGLRKILRKHDSLFELKMSELYFDSRLSLTAKHSTLLQLYHQEGLKAIIATIRRGFEDLYEARMRITSALQDEHTSLLGPRALVFPLPRRGTAGISRNLVRVKSMPQLLSTHLRRRSISDVEPILKKVNIATRRVSRSQAKTYGEYTAAHSEMALENRLCDLRRRQSPDGEMSLDSDSEDDSDSADEMESGDDWSEGNDHVAMGSVDIMEKGRGSSSSGSGLDRSVTSPLAGMDAKKSYRTTGLRLNLSATFLYMVNMYVVAPTSGEYARQLGGSSSLGGAIIGLAPLAALITAVIYSDWSNVCYRGPLIAGCYATVVGNLM